VAITVHGPFGSVDLVVPGGAHVADIAREYARQVRLRTLPQLRRVDGEALRPDTTVLGSGVRSGTVLVAGFGAQPSAPPVREAVPVAPAEGPGRGLPPLLLAMAAGCAALAGWLATAVGSPRLYDATLALLGAGALVGVLPLGRHQELRGAAAPVFGAAGAFALVREPGAETLPLALGIAALAAAVVAGIARALGTGSAIVHTVWMISGCAIFVFTGLGVLLDLDARVTWSVLLLVAVLAARSVAGQAVDVPDQMLLDLERLAVTAWSARDRPRGRRGRMVIRPGAMAELLARGGHIVNAASAAILVVTLASAPNVLTTTVHDIDHLGARGFTFFAGATLLLAARSYRHTPARLFLRAAGVAAWAFLARDLLDGASSEQLSWTLVGSVVLAVGVVVAAIATGRGWRSVKWARRAEIAETLAGAFTVAAVVVSSGLFREVWELPFGG
jgi:hypothetical protein